MKSLQNHPINSNIRGILYICEYDIKNNNLSIIKEIQFDNPKYALHAFASIPNPESQLAMGNTHEEFIEDLKKLHDFMTDPKKYKYLAEVL